MRIVQIATAATLALLLVLPAAARTTIRASSSYDDGRIDRGPEMAFDGRLDTTWSEGQAGAGVDEWIEIDLGKSVEVGSISIWGGDFTEGRKRFTEHNRLKLAEVVLTTDDGEITRNVEFGDRFARQEIRVGKSLRKVHVVIKDVYSGSIFDNTHIAEIAFDYPVREGESAVKMEKWKEGRSYGPAKEAYDAKLDAAFDACKAGEDYSANFKFIANAAVHGAPFVNEQVQEVVPPGYRGAFLRFDEYAVKYLQKLKDVNAIPYLEVARARATGDDEYWFEDLVKAFRAHEELISSRRHDIPSWGTTGLEPGALNGRGEPLSVDVNADGLVVVADTGNNRVEWYSTDGRVETIIGKQEGIAYSWFGVEGDPYATGAAPGDGPSEFEQPVALAVGNYNVLAVIDSTLRVQTFDEENNAVGDFRIPASFDVAPGRGCATPIVTWWGDDFYFLIGSEVWGYKPKGEQVIHFDTGETILAGVILDGKLLVRHGSRDIVEYALADGFRQGNWLKQPVPEDGSEDWDMATDADDDLYVATDAGWVYIYNKRGKFLRKVRMFDNPKDRMRIAVSPAMETLYVTAEDTIHRVDLAE